MTCIQEVKKSNCMKNFLNSSDNFIRYALNEFIFAGWMDKEGNFGGDEMQEAVCLDVLNLLAKLSEQEHSGGSIGYTISLFSKMAKFTPLTPLTGEDDEWNEISKDLYQNKRCFTVFKESGKDAHDLHGRIFIDSNGAYYTNNESSIPITFPYTPKVKYVKDEERVG